MIHVTAICPAAGLLRLHFGVIIGRKKGVPDAADDHPPEASDHTKSIELSAVCRLRERDAFDGHDATWHRNCPVQLTRRMSTTYAIAALHIWAFRLQKRGVCAIPRRSL